MDVHRSEGFHVVSAHRSRARKLFTVHWSLIVWKVMDPRTLHRVPLPHWVRHAHHCPKRMRRWICASQLGSCSRSTGLCRSELTSHTDWVNERYERYSRCTAHSNSWASRKVAGQLNQLGSRSPWLSGNVTTLEAKAHRQIDTPRCGRCRSRCQSRLVPRARRMFRTHETCPLSKKQPGWS